MDAVVRLASNEDAPLLVQLNKHVQQIHIEAKPDLFQSPLDELQALRFFKDMLSDGRTTIYIAEMQENAVGYILCQIRIRDENAFRQALNTLYIDQISVVPEYKRRGCGENLMQAAIDLAIQLGISHVALDVWAFNDTAQKFFFKQGFDVFKHQMELFLDHS